MAGLAAKIIKSELFKPLVILSKSTKPVGIPNVLPRFAVTLSILLISSKLAVLISTILFLSIFLDKFKTFASASSIISSAVLTSVCAVLVISIPTCPNLLNIAFSFINSAYSKRLYELVFSSIISVNT